MTEAPAADSAPAPGRSETTRRENGLGWPAADRGPAELTTTLGWPGRSVPVPRETTGPSQTTDAAESTQASRIAHPAPPTPPTEVLGAAAAAAVKAVGTEEPQTPIAGEDVVELARFRGRTGPLDRPARTRVFAVANQKGGVGKTTTAVNIAAALAQGRQRVLLVDLDPQGNASTALGIEHAEGTPGAYQALIEDRPVAELVQPAALVPGLDVLPAAIDLAGAEIDLVSVVARESRLRRALSRYLDERAGAGEPLDYVFIDCPPSLGLLTVNALVAGEEILIPIQCEYYALEGVGLLLRTVDMVRSHLNSDLRVSTIVLTMHDARTRLSAGVADEVRRHFPDEVLKATIPRSVRISEAPSFQQTVMTYDPSSPGALSYVEAAREISERGAVAAARTRVESGGLR